MLLDDGLKANYGLKKKKKVTILFRVLLSLFVSLLFVIVVVVVVVVTEPSFHPPSLISVSSYGERGGLTSRRPGHISDTGTAGGLCVSCSGV